MKNDVFYFPHFSNTRHERRIMRMEKELGLEAYAIYFKLLEILREQPDFKYPLKDIDLLADEIGSSEQKVRVVICNYQLFNVDTQEQFFSADLNESLQPYLKMKEQRKIAGKASAERRIAGNSTTVQQPFNDRSTTVQQSKVKESKVKESKVNIDISAKDFNWYNSQFDDLFIDQMKAVHPEKISLIQKAITESYAYLITNGIEQADKKRCKQLLNNWLKNMKIEYSFGNSKPQWHGGVKCS